MTKWSIPVKVKREKLLGAVDNAGLVGGDLPAMNELMKSLTWLSRRTAPENDLIDRKYKHVS